MKSKEKRKRKYIFLSIIVIWISILAIYYYYTNKQISYASSSNEVINSNVKISEAPKVNLDKIIKENTKEVTREEVVIEEVEMEYVTKYVNTSELVKGTSRVAQEGRNGIQQIIKKRTYDENNELISEEQVDAVMTKAYVNKVIEIGTAEQPKQAERKVVKRSASTGIGKLDFNMSLNKPSGFSLEQFKKALTDSNDVNHIFSDNAEFFYCIENQYNINGMFVAAVGIHESGWGKSKLALNKYNLFGYGAYDSNPYNGAYTFTSYSECIDLIARVFTKYYINPAGTSIYDGEKASGKYYLGSTLSSINKRYATDANWANSVYKYMQYLYNKLI